MAISVTEPELPPLIGQSAAFQAMLAEVSRLAPLDRPVLVVGERGTGKELVASRLAYLSRRWDKPIVKLNCAALPESLLDSELFGHEAGAFTGATRRRAGRFELADGGTLFLDEIAQASQAVQEKILRAVEYGVFDRVGGSTPVRVDVRVIAATNVDLPQAVAEGRFRADLLDRLAFDVVTIPPLRARREDVLLLAEHFGIGMARELGRDFFAGFTPAAREKLLAHSWPGNVRELKNAVERSVARATRPDRPLDDVVIDPFAAPWREASGEATNPPPTAPDAEPAAKGYEARVAEFEARLLGEALAAHRFNQQETARALGLGYHQLRRLLRKHKMLPGRDKAARRLVPA
ncbi:MAG: phage shock protein operon transcriptional activator [Rhodospirillales bacterium]|nr:phage shock protein operon transcriptional activator [Rhodospirillales bacterium]